MAVSCQAVTGPGRGSTTVRGGLQGIFPFVAIRGARFCQKEVRAGRSEFRRKAFRFPGFGFLGFWGFGENRENPGIKQKEEAKIAKTPEN